MSDENWIKFKEQVITLHKQLKDCWDNQVNSDLMRLQNRFCENTGYKLMDDDWIDVDDIISHIIAEDDDLGNSDIREILANYERPGDDDCINEDSDYFGLTFTNID